ncbi:MAG: hypothetical protein EXQ74_02740 [Thermoleophilia bacterium]|nr:hypothetical protein [Thermoleophilia bacterium]
MSGVVVMGATGGCGVTTLACGLALGRVHAHPLLVGADSLGGGPVEMWRIPVARSVDDLRTVIAELGPEHVGHVVHQHASGVAVLPGPSSPGRAIEWEGPTATALAKAVAAGGHWVADAGRGWSPFAAALATMATRVVVVVSGSLDAVVRARGVMVALDVDRITLIASALPIGGDLSARSLRRALGQGAVIEMPLDRRGARDIAAGAPARGRGIATVVGVLLSEWV